jgi:hypothetical protein
MPRAVDEFKTGSGNALDPERSVGFKKPTHKAEARIRMEYRAHVAWLEGYPLATAHGVAWQTIPRRGTPSVVDLDPQRLRKAARAVREMAREAREHRLEGVLEEVAPGFSRLEAALALAGRARREGVAHGPFGILSQRAAKLAEGLVTTSARRALANAIGWSTVVTRGEEDALRWVLKHRAALGTLSERLDPAAAVRVTCVLARLASTEPDRHVTVVLGLLGEEALFGTPTTQGKDSSPPAPFTSFGAHVIRTLEGLLGESPRTRLYALELLALVTPVGWVAEWREHWRSWAEWQRRKAGALSASVPRNVRRDLERQTPSAPKPPPCLVPETLFQCVLREAQCGDDRMDLVLSLLRALPPEERAAGVHARALVEFSERLRSPLNGRRDVDLVHALVAALGDAGTAKGAIDLWPSLTTQEIARRPRSPWNLIVDPLPERGSIDDYLAGLLRIGPGEQNHAPAARSILREMTTLGYPADSNVSFAALVAPRLDGHESRIDHGCLEFSLGLAKGDMKVAAEFVVAFAGSDRLPASGLLRLLAWSEELGALGVLRAEVAAKNLELLGRWVYSLAALGQGAGCPGPPIRALGPVEAGAAPRPAGQDEAWIRRYPPALRPALERLLGLPDAERRAHRLLRRALPDREALCRELKVVRKRLRAAPDSSLAARESALVARLDSPRELKATEVKKLVEKLDRATHQGKLERIDEAIERALLARLKPEGPAPENAWWNKPETRRVVAGVARLPAAEQRLGMRLIARRFGPPPWLPWDDPRNQQYLKSIRKRGVDVAPWLASESMHVDRVGQRVSLRLEDDPLEVLLMGERFSTCLSLDAMNFYSAVMNAVDVNKRVLYGRNVKGTVVGRCLLALTDEGRLLAFEPYAHDAKLGFDEMVATFVRSLAQRMHTIVVSQGRVLPLLGSRWYDDGPRDVAGALSALAEGSTLRKALRTIGPADALGAIEAALGEAREDEGLMARVLSLPEVRDRPELVLAIAPRFLTAERLGWEDRLTVASVVANAGAPELSRNVAMVAGFTRWVMQRCQECRAGCYPRLDRALAVLAKAAPNDALHLIRRARRTARDRRYENEERVLYEVIALKRLGREAQAEAAVMRGAARGFKRLRKDAEAILAGRRRGPR